MSHPVSQWSKEEEREYILDLLKRRDILRERDNVVYCHKAFIINSILKRCFNRSRKKTQTKEEWVRYLKIIDSYIKDKTEIRWNNGKFEVYEK